MRKLVRYGANHGVLQWRNWYDSRGNNWGAVNMGHENEDPQYEIAIPTTWEPVAVTDAWLR